MSTSPIPWISAAIEPHLDWFEASDAIARGHRLPRAETRDHVIEIDERTMLTRSAVVPDLGSLVKTANVYPTNRERGLPSVNGAVTLFDPDSGAPSAHIDFEMLTLWKTAADSALAARRLAPEHVDSVLIIGAGPMAAGLLRAYRDLYPDAQMSVASRTVESATKFADSRPGVSVARDLGAACRSADLITVATTATEPVVRGEWLRPGQHLDLVGAFSPGMREADDDAIAAGRLFVDSRATTIDHIGELIEPMKVGVLQADDIIADFYDFPSGRFERQSSEDITVFKNGGGAHLDLMVAAYIADVHRSVSAAATRHS